MIHHRRLLYYYCGCGDGYCGGGVADADADLSGEKRMSGSGLCVV